jgi:hypothetical protein
LRLPPCTEIRSVFSICLSRRAVTSVTLGSTTTLFFATCVAQAVVTRSRAYTLPRDQGIKIDNSNNVRADGHPSQLLLTCVSAHPGTPNHPCTARLQLNEDGHRPDNHPCSSQTRMVCCPVFTSKTPLRKSLRRSKKPIHNDKEHDPPNGRSNLFNPVPFL